MGFIDMDLVYHIDQYLVSTTSRKRNAKKKRHNKRRKTGKRHAKSEDKIKEKAIKEKIEKQKMDEKQSDMPSTQLDKDGDEEVLSSSTFLPITLQPESTSNKQNGIYKYLRCFIFNFYTSTKLFNTWNLIYDYD